MKKNVSVFIPLLIGILLFPGCSLHTPQKEFNTPDSPETFHNASGAGQVDQNNSEKWWLSFKDETLNKVMDEVVENNPDIEQAVQRYEQATAFSKQQSSYLLPEVSIGANAQASDSSAYDSVVNTYGISAAASYEIDLWGRVRSAKNAAGFSRQASLYDLKTIYVTIAARAAELYFQSVQKKEEIRILTAIESFKKNNLELAEMNYREGIADSATVYTAKQELAGAVSDLGLSRSLYRKTIHALSILQGKYPELPEDYNFPELPEIKVQFSGGLPSVLLKNRPDIQKALAAVKASDHEIGVAIAGRFPSINLIAGISESGTDITGSSKTTSLSSIAGNLMLPILDWGRRKAEVKKKKAAFLEKLSAFNQATLNGFKDVEDALADYNAASISLQQAKLVQAFSTASYKQTELKYLNGIISYSSVLAAHNQKLSTDIKLADSKLNVILKNISVARAMGGTWMNTNISQKTDSQEKGI